MLIFKGLAFRSMHSHGRALKFAACRRQTSDDVRCLPSVRDEKSSPASCSATTSGDRASLRNEGLPGGGPEALPLPGRASCAWSCSSPSPPPSQRYRIYDAASGLVEEGWVEVADMVERQPWLDGEPFPTRTA